MGGFGGGDGGGCGADVVTGGGEGGLRWGDGGPEGVLDGGGLVWGEGWLVGEERDKGGGVWIATFWRTSCQM